MVQPSTRSPRKQMQESSGASGPAQVIARDGIAPGALRREDAAAFCGVSPATWDRWRAKGRVPAPITRRVAVGRRFGGSARIVLWSRRHLELWLSWEMPTADAFARRLRTEQLGGVDR